MTTPPANVCTAGSRPQTGLNVLLALGAEPLKRLMPHDMSWVGDYLGLFGVSVGITGVQLCASGPAADPLLTTPELDAGLADLTGPAALLVTEKLTQIAERQAWYSFCECSDGAAPIVVPDIQAPADRPLVNPSPPLPGPVGQPCQSGTGDPFVQNGDSAIVNQHQFVGLTATALQINFGQRQDFGTPLGGTMTYQFSNKVGDTAGPLGTFAVHVPATGQLATVTIPLPLGTIWYSTFIQGAGDGTTFGGTNFATLENLYCGISPGQPLALNCCPPDPTLMATLELILQTVQGIHAVSAPTSWIDGAAHPLLAGAGSVPLAGHAIGIRVDMTTLPTGGRVSQGDPVFFWDSGFITPVALTSPLRGSRLVFEHQSFALPEFTDTVAYTLLRGTVVTITELLPVTEAAP